MALTKTLNPTTGKYEVDKPVARPTVWSLQLEIDKLRASLDQLKATLNL